MIRNTNTLKLNAKVNHLTFFYLAIVMANLFTLNIFTQFSLSAADEIRNPGFEEIDQGKIKHWKLVGPEPYFLLDNIEFFEGEYSLRISIGNLDDIVSLHQKIDVEASVRYEFAGMLKTQFEESGSLFLLVNFYNIDGREIESFEFPEIIESQQWTYHKMMIKAPNESDKAVVRFRIKGKGSVWIDDIYFSTMLRGLYG